MLKVNLQDLVKTIDEKNITEETKPGAMDIAIIGIAAKLPLAENIHEFWDNLKSGIDCITDLPKGRRSETDLYLQNIRGRTEPAVYKKGSYLENVSEFDCRFFNISPHEASLMDPNQRIFLEIAWSAMEDAGYSAEQMKGSRTGVYFGFVSDLAYQRFIADIEPESIGISIPGNMASIIPNRVSFMMDLKGPSLLIDTACSSSLVAVHTACRDLRNGDCEMAFVGSGKMSLLPLEDGNMLGVESRSYICRAFDDEADGTCMGEGVMAILLKPLSNALRDGDHIYAVIKGSAVNQDGASLGITAPNALAQAEVIEAAWRDAGIDPETITYIETHGTGTKLGDPIEIEGIHKAFSKYTSKKQFCAIGSVKTNLGHLDSAAGMAGLIKAILALTHRQIPPSLHFQIPNRNIDFNNSPVFVNNKLRNWDSAQSPRRCGVSAFGLGGTNSHIVLEEAPPVDSRNDLDRQVQIFTLSAKNQETLAKLIENFRDYLEANPDLSLADVCYTVNTGRSHYGYRLGIVTNSIADLLEKLNFVCKNTACATALETAAAYAGDIYYDGFKTAAVAKYESGSGSSNEADLRRITAIAGAKLKEYRNQENQADILKEICCLYIRGAALDWEDLYRGAKYRRLSLPAYPFERRRCWLEIPQKPAAGMGAGAEPKLIRAGERDQLPGDKETEAVLVTLCGGDDGKYSETERAIAQIWGQLLGFDQLDINDGFYELGGNSVIARKIINTMNMKFQLNLTIPVLLSFQTIKKMAAFIDQSSGSKGGPAGRQADILPLAGQEFYELSSAQKRIFLIEAFGNAGVSYNMSSALVIEGDLDPNKLEGAFQTIIDRHEALRTSFEFRGDQPVQIIHPAVDFQISYREAGTGDPEEFIKGFITRFDLSQAPLLRVGLIKQAEQKYILIVDLHHIITDGTSTNMIIRELIEVYEGKRLPGLRVQYKDFAAWQNQLFESEYLRKAEEYWIRQFGDRIPVLNLPTDYPRPPIQEFVGSGVYFQAGTRLTGALRQLALETGTTLFMILLSAYQILLDKYSGEEDVVVGTAVSGRNHLDTENMMGIFLNNLAMRGFPKNEMSFADYLSVVKENTLKAFEFQDYPFERLVEKLNVPRDLSRNPLFDVLFLMQNIEMPELKTAGMTISKYEYDFGTSIYDLVLQALEKDGNLTLLIEYCARLFRPETISRMGSHLLKILQVISENPAVRISDIDILSEGEKRRLLLEFNDTRMDYEAALTIQERFEAQVARTPEAVALVFGQNRLTYRELNCRANQLAGLLRKNGVKAGSILGVMVERSPEMLIAVLGALKAGAAYLPLDPEYPEERIKYMLADSQTFILLTKDGKGRIDWECRRIPLDDPALLDQDPSNLTAANTSADLAYLIYTSGSTGRPKGVMIEHRAVHNFIEGVCQIIEFRPGKTILALTTISFDIFVLETLLPLTRGLTIVIASEAQQRDPQQLRELIETQGVEMIQITPSRMKLLMDADRELDCLKKVREIMIGGEALPRDLFDVLRRVQGRRNGMGLPPLKIYNMYGPTETTVWSAIKDLSDGEITIGKPIANTQIYILDRSNRPQPLGVAGELWIGGDGTARGYLNRPELTAEKFVPNPFHTILEKAPQGAPLPKMYRTGDLARWLPDGELEFLGRIDHQVKLRGYRIELGEIEAELLKLDGIKEAVVTVRSSQSGDKYLCAYLISDSELTVPELRKHLGGRIPEYMIPAFFVRLDTMPLTPNGKVDRKQLPEPDASVKTGREYVAPTNELEANLARIWAEILQVDRVGIHDNFFELGGDSLKAVRIMYKIQQTLGLVVSIPELFANPTIRELADGMAHGGSFSGGGNTYEAIPRAPEKEYYRITPAQRRLFFLDLVDQESTAYNIPSVTVIEGPLDRVRLTEAFWELIRRHESLRTYFEMVDDVPAQKIHSVSDFRIDYREAAPEADIQQLARDFIRPFDLRRGPLLRVGLVKQTDTRHILICLLHHIISDGISMNILARDYISLYNGDSLPELRIQYKDYAEWLESEAQIRAAQKQERYWLERFAGKLPVLNLPTDFPRPTERSFEGDTLIFEAAPETITGLNRTAREAGTTLFMVLLAAYNILLAKYSGQEDIIVGSPVAGRRHPDLEPLIGMFVNTVALRNFPEREKTFSRFLEEVKRDSLAAFENQDYQFEKLVDKLNLGNDLSRNPLFDVLFVLQKNEFGQTRVGELKFTNLQPPSNTAKFDLSLEVESRDGDQTLCFGFEYCVRLFKDETIRRFAADYLRILETVTANPEIRIKDIQLQESFQKREKGITKEIEFDF